MNIDFEIAGTTRVLTWVFGNHAGTSLKEIIAIELPPEIHIRDIEHKVCPDDEDHECNFIEILDASRQLFDPVYVCSTCGEGPYLIAFHGEPSMLLAHIEQYLKIKRYEIVEGIKTTIRFAVPAV